MQIKFTENNWSKYPSASLHINDKIVNSQLVNDKSQFDDVVDLSFFIKDNYSNLEFFDHMIKTIFQAITNYCEPLDVRYKLTLKEKAERLVNNYTNKRDYSLNRIKELQNKKEGEINSKEIDEMHQLNNKFEFGFNFDYLFDENSIRYKNAEKDAKEYIESLLKK